MHTDLVLKVDLETFCMTPTSHVLNHDGYFRKMIGGVWYMYHRYVWEKHRHPIPKGSEINHKCRNRACCNLSHLEVLTRNEHLVLTNKTRYLARNKEAQTYWERGGITASDVAEKFGVCRDTVLGWIRQWKVLRGYQ